MHKRIIALTTSIVLLFVAIVGRIGYITMSGAYMVSDSYSSYSLVIDKLEPNMYYSNGTLINNNVKSNVLVIRPNAKCLSEMRGFFSYNEQIQIRKDLEKGYPVIKNVDKKYNPKYIQAFEQKSTQTTLNQLLSPMSSGLISHCEISGGELRINYGVDALGRLLSGDEGRLIDNNYSTKEGLVLSINKDIQDIVYNACEKLDNGCAIVMNVKTGDIVASVTKPDDCYINKPFLNYSVGSVFKLVVSVCALENNVDLYYNCNGSIIIGDTIFSCQNNHKHGYQSLKYALANSCNCYFVNLAITLGKDKIRKTAQDLGFCQPISIYNDWRIDGALFPTDSDLQSTGQLALLGFGQGKILVSPLEMCSVISTISNSGYYHKPNLVIGKVDKGGQVMPINHNDSIKLLSNNSAKKMVKYMRYVVTNGTGFNAESSSHKSAGKTATAETGQYINGTQINNTWFAGVYPFDAPKYAIVIMKENGQSGSEDCCPIFRTIVENIDSL